MMFETFKCDHLCLRYIDKECFTEDGEGMCDQPEMYRELGDHIDYLIDLAREGEME
jgi:hypothetical protein